MWALLAMVSVLDWGSFVTPPTDVQRPYILDCINPDVQYVASFCGLQSGKTYAESDGGYAALYGPNPIMLPKEIRGRIPMEVWLISRNYALAEVLFDTFRSRTPPDIWATDKQVKAWGLTRGDRFTHWLVPREGTDDPCPIKLIVRTASDPESLRATNKLGLAICDELAHWKPMAWNNLQARGIVVRTKFLIATSPKGKNFIYRAVALPGGYKPGVKGKHPIADKKIAVHSWTSADNPYADEDHIERLRKLFGREYAKQELDGLFTDAIGYVFGEFDRTTMMVSGPPSTEPEDYDLITGGADPGWTDPFAGGVWARWKGDGRWYQLSEIHETQSTPVDVAPLFVSEQNKWNVPTWWTDKRKPTDIALLRRAGVRAKPNIDIHAENDRRTIPPMLAVCQGLMQDDKIRILKDHEWTAEEFENYHYPDPSEEHPKNTNDIPVDWMNHHMDAMRYGLCSVLEVSHSGPRYRKGPSQTPQEVKRTEPKRLIPTLAESLAAQDARMDQAAERDLGGHRKSAGHFMRLRMRTRKELM